MVPKLLTVVQSMPRVRRPRSDKYAFPCLRDDLHNEVGSSCCDGLDILAENCRPTFIYWEHLGDPKLNSIMSIVGCKGHPPCDSMGWLHLVGGDVVFLEGQRHDNQLHETVKLPHQYLLSRN